MIKSFIMKSMFEILSKVSIIWLWIDHQSKVFHTLLVDWSSIQKMWIQSQIIETLAMRITNWHIKN